MASACWGRGFSIIYARAGHQYNGMVYRPVGGNALDLSLQIQTEYHSEKKVGAFLVLSTGYIHPVFFSPNNNAMGNLFYDIVILLVIASLIGFLGFIAGKLIPILMVIVIISVILKKSGLKKQFGI